MVAPHDGSGTTPERYPWMAAPAHLMTRRQLRAAGLRPGGQAPVAVMSRRGRGGREIVAWLYDSRQAPKKRVATPAQLAAVAKAVREHQARAAERRGLSRAELTTSTDPGPAWNTATGPATERKNTMTDDTTPAAHLDDPEPESQLQVGFPTGHGQRVTHLHALIAVNRAAQKRDGLARVEDTAGHGEDGAVDGRDTDQRRARDLAELQKAKESAEARLSEVPWHNRDALAHTLAEALSWSQRSDRAADVADKIARQYATEWGVVVDPADLTVALDQDFHPGQAQALAETAQQWARDTAVVEAVTATAPKAVHDKVARVMDQWRGQADSDRDEQARRDDLAAGLAEITMTARERSVAQFSVDYLHRDTSHVDLLHTPALVDPSVEARGRVPELLELFAAGKLPKDRMGAAIALMTAEDQDRVRDVGRGIVAGENPDLQVWPGYVDRDRVRDELTSYVTDAAAQRADSDTAAEQATGPEFGVADEVAERMTRMAGRRDWLRGAADAKGLHALEKTQLLGVLDDIDVGRIASPKQLPELLFVDERSKAATDAARVAGPAAWLADTTRAAVDQMITDAHLEPTPTTADRLNTAVAMTCNTVHNVAAGPNAEAILAERKNWARNRDKLTRALADAGAGDDIVTGVRAVVVEAAREAGTLGRTADERRRAWVTRTAKITHDRDDRLAQRQAATAGQTSRPRQTHTQTRDTDGQEAAQTLTRTAPPRHHHATSRRRTR